MGVIGKNGAPTFWGLLGVGMVAMAGGIAMFIYVVPRDLESHSAGVTRDMALLFTNVFLEQKNHFNEKNRYAAALPEVKVKPEICARYSCRLTVPADGTGYVFRMSKDGRIFAINEKMNVPKEVKESL